MDPPLGKCQKDFFTQLSYSFQNCSKQFYLNFIFFLYFKLNDAQKKLHVYLPNTINEIVYFFSLFFFLRFFSVIYFFGHS